MTIQAIPTRYAGCYFRSRLEARWAVFFDKLRVPWEYESEGFMTSAGAYLPDFRVMLPGSMSGQCQWFEVKPENSLEDLRHAALADGLGQPLIVARGLPRSYEAQLLSGRTQNNCSPLNIYGLGGENPGPWPVAFADGTSNYKSYYCALRQNRHWCQDHIGYYSQFGEPCHLTLYGLHQDGFMTHPPIFSPNIDAAYAVARSARFERGEA